MVRGREDSDLLHNDHGATGEGEEDLAHDKVTDGLVGLAEVDHEALAEHVKWNSPVQYPAEAACLLDSEANREEEKAGHDIEDRGNVTGGLERLAAVHLQE